MTTNELLALMDREAQLLADHNWHASACVMKEAAEHLRKRYAVERALRDLIAFVDGLTYAQLERVDGLFTAAREARKALPPVDSKA